MKTLTTILSLFVSAFLYAQQRVIHHAPAASSNVVSEKEKEDFDYEIRHKSQSWFTNMNQPAADYFAVKDSFDTYFASRSWEKSKPRALGESWLKTKIFYLDNQGKVQEPPVYNVKHSLRNKPGTTTTRTIGTWTMIGPVNSAFTSYSNKYNHGGYVYLNRFDPSNPKKIFAAFVTGGLWMTIDGGKVWTLTDGNLADLKYSDIDVCLSAPQVVYAINEKQVIKSVDGGFNWLPTSLNAQTTPGKAYDIAVSTSNPDVVVARWGNKIYRTNDGGKAWRIVIDNLPDYGIWDCSIHSEMLDWSSTNKKQVYVLSITKNNTVDVYRSTNAGSSFSMISSVRLDSAANGKVVGWAKLLSSNNKKALYVAVGTGANAYAHRAVQLYKLDNRNGKELLKRVNMIPGSGRDEMHHGDIAMDRKNENNIVYGTYGQDYIHYSNDNGASFKNSTAKTHSDIRSMDIVGSQVLIGSDGETSLSEDGGLTCATITNSVSNHELWGFGSAFKSGIMASGNNHGPVMVSEAADGFEWYNGPGADQGNTDVNPLDDRYIYSQGYSNYRFFRTGVHKLINERNLLDVGGIYSYFNSVEFHPNYYYTIITHHAAQYPKGNPNLATWKNSLIKTEDNGKTVSIVKTFDAQVFREKICMTNPEYIYVVAGLTKNKLWRTADDGRTWTDITPPSAVTSGHLNISDLAVSDVNPDEVWITYSGVQTVCKVLKTVDGGKHWVNLTQPLLTAHPNTKIIFQRGSDGGVYVGNKTGIYYRNNAMDSWVMLGAGLPALDVRFMFINYNRGKLLIGSSRGAWEHDLFEISPPKAQIAADKKIVNCPDTDTVQFKDYSTVRNASATWNWSFPGGNPATSDKENPVVSYKNAAPGFYSAKLTVTDAHGTSEQTIKNMIEVVHNCPEGK